MKIVKYEVVSRSDLLELQDEVNKLIQKGWQPFGNLVVASIVDPHGSVYIRHIQPMVIY